MTSLGLLIAIVVPGANEYAVINEVSFNGTTYDGLYKLYFKEVSSKNGETLKYCDLDDEDLLHKKSTICRNSNTLIGLGTAAVISNSLFILAGFFVLKYKTRLSLFIVLLLLLMGLTSGIIAQQVIILKQFIGIHSDLLFSEFGISISMSYQLMTGFYFSITCLVLQTITCGILRYIIRLQKQ